MKTDTDVYCLCEKKRKDIKLPSILSCNPAQETIWPSISHFIHHFLPPADTSDLREQFILQIQRSLWQSGERLVSFNFA